MAAVKTEDPTPSVDAPSNCVDPLDIEQYINPEHMTTSSPSMSPGSLSYKTSTVATPTAIPQPYLQPQPHPEQHFSAPSHRYEQYRQQASLPVGAVANTFALNEANPYGFGQDSYDLLLNDSYMGTNNTDEYLDLGVGSEQLDLDMDFNSQARYSSMKHAESSQPYFQTPKWCLVPNWSFQSFMGMPV